MAMCFFKKNVKAQGAVRYCPICLEIVSADASLCPHCGQSAGAQRDSIHLPPGVVLNTGKRQYLIGGVKGTGGFGITYAARELRSGMKVAVKEYFPTRCGPQRQANGAVFPTHAAREMYENGMKSFLAEATMLNALRQLPSIVHVLDWFQANNTAYIAMEYIEGVSLKDMMQMQGRFEPTMLLRKMLPLIRDLQLLHNANVLHRDIAPDNILRMPDGTLRLIDFGCARSMEDGKSMTVLHKSGFTPIEQYTTGGQGPFTDVYALCASIYYCVSGKIPPGSMARVNDISDRKPDPLLPLPSLGVIMSPAQSAVIHRGLAPMPKDRIQDMGALLRELEIAGIRAENGFVTPKKEVRASEKEPEKEQRKKTDTRTKRKTPKKTKNRKKRRLTELLWEFFPGIVLAVIALVILIIFLCS